MIVFGALDLFAFYRSFPKVIRLFENYTAGIYQFMLAVLVVSLLVSGPLLIVGNKIGSAVYYFQFPVRVTYIPTLTVGFLMPALPLTPGTLYYGMLLATIYAVEAIRLMHTIQRQRHVR